MRTTNPFPRTTLAAAEVRRIIDRAASHGVAAISFTGGEPLLELDPLVELIKYAGRAGIPYIRTGTNGFVFRGSTLHERRRRTTELAERLANTPLRNFWISVDSAVPAVHESMRGLKGVVEGIREAIPIFHEHGIYPAANLGINRNLNGAATRDLRPEDFADRASYLAAFREAFDTGFRRFYAHVLDMGFTTANACYPMSVEPQEGDLEAVYSATSEDRVVRFDRDEKAVLFETMREVIPAYRPNLRVFTPLCSLLALARHYRGEMGLSYPCRGGVDFLFVEAREGKAFPCGYRGHDDFGRHSELAELPAGPADCRDCDWECFRDPSELAGPLIDLLRQPWALARRFWQDREFARTWFEDLLYYRSCGWFHGRRPPELHRLHRHAVADAPVPPVEPSRLPVRG
jgi:MoaA/NifB/PqqE/SkfB family radical SAM enzyme